MTNVETLEIDVMFVQMKEIFKMLNSELLNKIPEKIREYILNYESKNSYKFIYDINKRLYEQNLTEDTRRLIAYFDYYYWADDNDRKQIDSIWNEKEASKDILNKRFNNDVEPEKNVSKIKLEEVTTNQVAKITNNLEQEIAHENNEIIVKKEGFLTRLVNKIKSIFSKK